MKIVNVNKFYYLRGGVERYFFELGNLLTRHGHEVIPFAMEHPLNLPTPYAKYFPSYVEFGQGCQLSVVSCQLSVLRRMFWSFETARKFDALLTDTKPDLIHLHNIYHHLSPSLLPVAKRHGIPVVMTVHDYKLVWPHHLLYGYKKGASYWNVVRERCTQGSYLKSALTVFETYLHNWLRVYHKNIDLFLAPRQFVKEMLVEAGYDAVKIQVLPHFMYPSKFQISNFKSQTPHHPSTSSGGTGQANSVRNIQHSTFNILFFGRIAKEKGLDILLEMMHNMGSGIQLRIIGTGPELENCKLQATSYKLRNVTFLGYVDDEALAEEIDRATFVVIPSIFPETFGFTVLESFAHGKAVVASRIGAVPELVQDGKNGLLVAPGDARDLREKVQYLLAHPEERRAMERCARAVVKEYTPERHYETLLAIYQKLL